MYRVFLLGCNNDDIKWIYNVFINCLDKFYQKLSSFVCFLSKYNQKLFFHIYEHKKLGSVISNFILLQVQRHFFLFFYQI